MSLARLALRMAAVRAVRGATLAGGRVFDSDASPLDHRLRAEAGPVVIIYTDDHTETPRGRADMASGATACDLVFEFAITTPVEPQGDDDPGYEVAATDAGAELLLDLMERQIVTALTGRQGVWPDLWRIFCVAIRQRTSKRAASAADGTRFAARQLILTCDLLVDPTPGITHGAGSAWARWLSAISADPALASIAPLLATALDGNDMTADALAAATLGVNREVTDGLGLAGILIGEDPAILTEGSLDEGLNDA